MRFHLISYLMLNLFSVIIMSNVSAQFKSVTIGVDGLNCPSCSYGVEQSLRKLDFVQDIKTDLNNATATITFSPDKKVSIDDLSKKVYQAGFSVRFMNAVYHFGQLRKVVSDTVMINERVFYFLQTPTAVLQGDVRLQLIGEKFVSKKTLKQWEPQMQLARIKYPMLRPDTYFVLL